MPSPYGLPTGYSSCAQWQEASDSGLEKVIPAARYKPAGELARGGNGVQPKGLAETAKSNTGRTFPDQLSTGHQELHYLTDSVAAATFCFVFTIVLYSTLLP
jgi:hypothetical protein